MESPREPPLLQPRSYSHDLYHQCYAPLVELPKLVSLGFQPADGCCPLVATLCVRSLAYFVAFAFSMGSSGFWRVSMPLPLCH